MKDSDRLAVNAFIMRALEKKGKASLPSIAPTEAQKKQYKTTHLREFRRLCVTGADVFKNELSGAIEDKDAADTLNLEPVRVQTFNAGFEISELIDEAESVFRRSNYPELALRLARVASRHFEVDDN